MTNWSGEGWFLELEEQRIDLREGEVTLGRSRGCGVVLRDPSVSRGHALLSVRQGRVTLQDLRSSNGTYVNGKRLDKETVLEDGDRLVIGETELFLHRAAEGAAGPEGSGGRRIETGEVSLFCPACGLPIHGSPGSRCPGCGAELAGSRLPRISEAMELSEVLPAGEALSAGAPDSWEHTSFRQKATGTGVDASDGTGSREVPPPAPSPAPAPVPSAGSPATVETRPRAAGGAPATPPTPAPLAAVPMSVREAERRPPTRERPAAVRTPTPVPPLPPSPPGLWSRLTGYFRGRRQPPGD